MLPIPLKHLHTLRVKFSWFGGLDDDLREAIHAAGLQGWSMTSDNDGQIFKSCSEHVGTTPNSKLIPEKRCLNFSLCTRAHGCNHLNIVCNSCLLINSFKFHREKWKN